MLGKPCLVQQGSERSGPGRRGSDHGRSTCYSKEVTQRETGDGLPFFSIAHRPLVKHQQCVTSEQALYHLIAVSKLTRSLQFSEL